MRVRNSNEFELIEPNEGGRESENFNSIDFNCGRINISVELQELINSYNIKYFI